MLKADAANECANPSRFAVAIYAFSCQIATVPVKASRTDFGEFSELRQTRRSTARGRSNRQGPHHDARSAYAGTPNAKQVAALMAASSARREEAKEIDKGSQGVLFPCSLRVLSLRPLGSCQAFLQCLNPVVHAPHGVYNYGNKNQDEVCLEVKERRGRQQSEPDPVEC